MQVYLDKFYFINSDYQIPIISLAYLLFVIIIGPNLMKNRDPVKCIRKIIPFYNVFQVFINSYLVVLALQDINFIKFSFSNLCGNQTPSDIFVKNYIYLGYLWVLIKVSDLLDTIFFILLKKFKHVSTLHVYHHVTTMFAAFVVVRYLRCEQSLLYAGVNSGIHIIMYSYYLLTSLGYKPRWKKIVTILQLMQFLSLMILTIVLIPCQTNIKYKYFSIYGVLQCIMYIYLFLDFYMKTYKSKNIIKEHII